MECIATCICRVVSRVLSELNPRFSTVIDAFVGTALVVAGGRINTSRDIKMSIYLYNFFDTYDVFQLSIIPVVTSIPFWRLL